MWLVSVEPQMYRLGVLEEMRVEEKEKQTYKKELTRKLIPAKDWFGQTIWHEAEILDNLKVLETLCSGAKKAKINTEEFLLDQNEFGNTALQFAAQNK